jgi:hypothetical protein
MPPVGFEPTIPESARPQTHALDRAATGIGFIQLYYKEFSTFCLGDSCTLYLLFTKVANLGLCSVDLVWFPDDDPFEIETCSNILCNIII